MNKTRCYWLIIFLLVLLIHFLGLWLILSNKFTRYTKPAPQKSKPITIEYLPKPRPKKPDLPTMLPAAASPTPPPTPPQQTAENTAQQAVQNVESTKSNVLPLPISKSALLVQKIKQRQSTKPSIKPVLEIQALNQYAIAMGNSAFKNQGVNRAPKPTDLAHLTYQEKIRRHFTDSFNRYAGQISYYSLDVAQIVVQFTVLPNGEVADTAFENLSHNPALNELITKILRYAAPFPTIPAVLKINRFEVQPFTVTVSKGRLTSGYGWN